MCYLNYVLSMLYILDFIETATLKFPAFAAAAAADLKANYREYMQNLDKLTVYVDGRGGREGGGGAADTPPAGGGGGTAGGAGGLKDNVCGFISRFNDALFQPLLHIQCATPLKGRYVYIEAVGVANRWTRLFSAILCEVMVYQ